MYRQVYHQITEKIAENMILKCIEINLRAKFIDIRELYDLNDMQLLNKLKENKETEEIVDKYLHRDLYYNAYCEQYSKLDATIKELISDSNIPYDYGNIPLWEKSLAEKIKVPENDIIIDFPITKYYETKVKIWDEKNKTINALEDLTQFTAMSTHSIDYILCAVKSKENVNDVKNNLFKVL